MFSNSFSCLSRKSSDDVVFVTTRMDFGKSRSHHYWCFGKLNSVVIGRGVPYCLEQLLHWLHTLNWWSSIRGPSSFLPSFLKTNEWCDCMCDSPVCLVHGLIWHSVCLSLSQCRLPSWTPLPSPTWASVSASTTCWCGSRSANWSPLESKHYNTIHNQHKIMSRLILWAGLGDTAAQKLALHTYWLNMPCPTGLWKVVVKWSWYVTIVT